MGIPRFLVPSADAEFKAMVKSLQKAAAKDRRNLRQNGAEATNIVAAVRGEEGAHMRTLFAKAVMNSIAIIRKGYAGIAIRRTLRSVDYAGTRISGLEMYREHILKIQLYAHEIQNLELIAQDLIKDGSYQTAQFSGGSVRLFVGVMLYLIPSPVQDFYLKIRRALVHRSLNPGIPWKNPLTLEDWREDASRKLDVLSQIILWHLEKDGQAPLKVENDKLVPSEPSTCVESGLAADKIVVYCAFPSSYHQISQVSYFSATYPSYSLLSHCLLGVRAVWDPKSPPPRRHTYHSARGNFKQI